MEKPDTCNCCEGLSVETPVEVFNRPGLKGISYRTGDYSKFRESLFTRLSQLPTKQAAALRQLTTRNNSDFSIALLDAWAMVCDVLTFYQERIANESYLGTAIEQFSIVELARLIGYELNPGVAANTWLAFTIEEASLAMPQAALTGVARGKEENPPIFIEPGTRVQSIPGKDEEPQNFETIEKIEARVEWNAMKPRTSQPYSDFLASQVIALRGVGHNLKTGDILMLRKTDDTKALKKIAKLAPDESAGLTLVHFVAAAQFPGYTLTSGYTYSAVTSLPKTLGNFVSTEAQGNWLADDFAATLKMQGWAEDDVRNSFSAAQASSYPQDAVFVFRRQAAIFGYNAPLQPTCNFTPTPAVLNHPAAWVEWGLAGDERINELFLDNSYDQILEGSYVLVQEDKNLDPNKIFKVNAAETRPRTAYSLSGKPTHLELAGNWRSASSNITPLRNKTVHVQSEELPLAELPIEAAVGGSNKVELSRLYLGLQKGRTVIVSGELKDLPGVFASETQVLSAVEIIAGRTVLTFPGDLANTYVRKTFTVNANVAKATHGESIREVLGSGDAAVPFQKFVLKHAPLTFVSAATPSGTLSTLQIRVNDILWHEVPSLYEREPAERIFITRQDDKGKTTVIFGDGKNGSRLPTGQENVVATYRKGIGSKGLLKANQLSQLVSRPLGVKAVTNPHPPLDAQDGERLADARQNATLTMFTLGRAVSLKDYEDFARAFAGIAKSLATLRRNGLRQEIFLTVAGVNGAPVSDELIKKLQAAIGQAGVPGVGIRAASFQAKFFRFVAKIQVLPDFLAEKVLQDIEMRVRKHFSFEARTFGQPVVKSELYSVIQDTVGVSWVDLDSLYFTGSPTAPNDRLLAALPDPDAALPTAAELLTLDLSPLQLSVQP